MRLFAIGFLLLSTLLTVGIAIYYLRYGKCSKPSMAVEGFAEEVPGKKLTAKQRIDKASAQASNILLDIVAKAKKASAHVTDPSVWKERLTMATMTPTELARKHLKAEQEAKK